MGTTANKNKSMELSKIIPVDLARSFDSLTCLSQACSPYNGIRLKHPEFSPHKFDFFLMLYPSTIQLCNEIQQSLAGGVEPWTFSTEGPAFIT